MKGRYDEGFRIWLEAQSRETCVAIAFRSAMRVLPWALNVDLFEGAERLALMSFRAVLTTGVAAVRPIPELKIAADAVSDATSDASRASAADSKDFSIGSAAHCAADAASWAAYAAGIDVTSYAGIAIGTIGVADLAADDAYVAFTKAYVPGGSELAMEAIHLAAYADATLDVDSLLTTAIESPEIVAAIVTPAAAGPTNALQIGGPWTFWATWYARAMAGDPLPWDLQKKIALISGDLWDDGPDAVALEIALIERNFRGHDILH